MNIEQHQQLKTSVECFFYRSQNLAKKNFHQYQQN